LFTPRVETSTGSGWRRTGSRASGESPSLPRTVPIVPIVEILEIVEIESEIDLESGDRERDPLGAGGGWNH